MTAKLNQIIAVEKGIKSAAHAAMSEIYKVVQKPDLFAGFSKIYKKISEDGEDFPAESKRVQFRGDDVMVSVAKTLTGLMEITARKDWTNCVAKADVSVDGVVIVAGAPVSYLLFLEKSLVDLRTLVAALPVLDENESWTMDTASGLFKTDVTQTHKSKKIQRPIVMYEATPHHPAQTQMITDDQNVGYWHQVKMSGAVPKPDRDKLAERVDRLLRAVKMAREEANGLEEIVSPQVGPAVFKYLLGAGA